jgi:hypothetical protein
MREGMPPTEEERGGGGGQWCVAHGVGGKVRRGKENERETKR